MLSAIIAVLGGVLASSSLIIAKKPNAKDLIDKLTPFQGWIGILLAFWGLWGTIQLVLNLGSIGLVWIIALGISVVEFVVGFVLGYSLISKYFLERSEAAKERGQQLRVKLIKYQVPGGILLIILGVLSIVF